VGLRQFGITFGHLDVRVAYDLCQLVKIARSSCTLMQRCDGDHGSGSLLIPTPCVRLGKFACEPDFGFGLIESPSNPLVVGPSLRKGYV